jgi:ATP-dependent DNA helicase RecQ
VPASPTVPAAAPSREGDALRTRICTVLSSYWGFTDLRPMQFDAVRATLANRDALVVLPTGGGKSLCYQLPPLLRDPGQPSLCIVVSPLIALMKDQVDGMKLAGYPAGALHSGVSYEDSAEIRRDVESGKTKLLLVAPERLLGDGFLAWLVRLGQRDSSRGVASIAIDEAHCISQWGHDFRPEYRRLLELRETLPGVPMQAFTATATPRVREDIIAQLHMHEPAVLVGTFDRPNLTYRVVPRVGNGIDQIEDVLRRHQGESGSNETGEAAIVYCMSRKQTEEVAAELSSRGLKAEAYHAGMDSRARHRVQEAFSSERLNIVVATVAFGMGIDRGDVRCVIHASSPKSVEAYQQETGRAGRDGLPAECVLLYSGADAAKWTSLVDRSAGQSEVHVPYEVVQAQKDLINQMQRMAAGTRCRHRALSEYFGQDYVPPSIPESTAGGASCNACDVCLGELEVEPDSTTIARKILSCVARLRGTREDSFGAVYIADVLRGAGIAKIIERQHHLLSTFGLLKGLDKDTIVNHISQLVDMGVLARAPGEYPTIHLTADSSALLRGEREVSLYRAKAADVVAGSDRKRRRNDYSGVAASPLSPEEKALFESLRQLRRGIAEKLGVPPYVVFSDAPLEEMARVRPGSLATFAHIKGVGRAKLEQFGERFVEAINEHCTAAGLAVDVGTGSRPRPTLAERAGELPTAASDAKKRAFEMFARGMGVEDVAAQIGRARSTTSEYLSEFIELKQPKDISPWVSAADYARILESVGRLKAERLKPIFDDLGGDIGYDQIRIALYHRANSPAT